MCSAAGMSQPGDLGVDGGRQAGEARDDCAEVGGRPWAAGDEATAPGEGVGAHAERDAAHPACQTSLPIIISSPIPLADLERVVAHALHGHRGGGGISASSMSASDRFADP